MQIKCNLHTIYVKNRKMAKNSQGLRGKSSTDAKKNLLSHLSTPINSVFFFFLLLFKTQNNLQTRLIS